ncbi:MAG TPA: RDD family protein [Planctomycetota bacterium]|nr:RDD family protein [Planctomycetota bacterium]
MSSSTGPGALRYRTLRRRIVAGLIDILVLQLPWSAHAWIRERHPHVVLFVLWYVALRVLIVAYGIAAHARWGQTLGKRLRGLRLLDVSETRLPSLRQCVLRDILPVLQLPVFLVLGMPDLLAGRDPALQADRVLEHIGLSWLGTLWIVAELLTMFAGRNGRSLPDYVAGTVVVRTDAEPGTPG